MMFFGLLINLFTSIILPILEGMIGIICQIGFWLFNCTLKLAYRIFMWLVDKICDYLNKVKGSGNLPPPLEIVANGDNQSPFHPIDIETPNSVTKPDNLEFQEPPEKIN